MNLLITVTLFGILLLSVYVFSKFRYTYWTRKGLAQLEPTFPYGNVKTILTGESSLADGFLEIYQQLKKQNLKHAGIYWFFKPQYIPLDLGIIKNILQNDFWNFMGHGFYHNQHDILTKNLFRLEGDEWRNLRSKLTSTFTSAKMRTMFDILMEKTDDLVQLLDETVKSHESVKIENIATRFTIDATVSCTFGMESHSLKNEECDFKKYGDKFVEPNLAAPWLEMFVPWKVLPYTGYKIFGDLEDFLYRLVLNIMDYRKKHNIYRKDFIQLLMEMGELQESDSKEGECPLSKEDIVAQCFLFFTAGYETSASTITFAMYEIAQNQEVQQKIRDEINKALEKCDGKLTYKVVSEMTYLEKVVQETLRKYPPVSTLPRLCSKTYKVPETDVVIDEGTMVQIPILGIHMDPDYYPEPEVFNPERFNNENKAKRPKFTWMPFGEGPRTCLGSGFGMLQSKIGIMGLIKNYNFTLNERSPRYPLVMKKGLFTSHSSRDIWLDITKTNQ
ncbi:probable cytochrome P450 6a20 [Cylas formicarius]|uniref:probable cytochrome P450 6a20 n=1 Tax=Cylas formicarius TaxID=197179 RepID=UPI0029585B61|nr:probable cytochrome P450 6a20 [Cylas formicarius]